MHILNEKKNHEIVVIIFTFIVYSIEFFSKKKCWTVFFMLNKKTWRRKIEAYWTRAIQSVWELFCEWRRQSEKSMVTTTHILCIVERIHCSMRIYYFDCISLWANPDRMASWQWRTHWVCICIVSECKFY